MPKWVTQLLAPLLCGVLLLLGVVALNSVLRGYFRDTQRCTLAFRDIECEPPGQLTRDEFLGEVQYLANWPDEINLLEDGLLARLHLSFAAHPWVEAVESVTITPQHQVRVLLRYRTPALAIAQADDKTAPWMPGSDGKSKIRGRVVDGHGVLLPQAAAEPRLPILYGTIPQPTGHTGQSWGDNGVAKAAAVAALLAPYQNELKLTRFEIAGGKLLVANERTRVLWAPLSGDETPAASRVQILLDMRAKRGSLDGWLIDLCMPEQPVVSSLKSP